MKILGIDEAGRGPCLGPMVICGALIEESQQNQLKQLGVKDSKLLTPSIREELFKIIPNFVQFNIIVISPQEIDESVFSETSNLNWLEALKTVEIIKILKPEKAIIDCPSPNIASYKNFINIRLPLGHNIILQPEHKADVNHLIVGAASILAKVTRDNLILELQKKIGIDFGSGYPSDPKTKRFLKENWNKYPEIFRKSWSTYKKYSLSLT